LKQRWKTSAAMSQKTSATSDMTRLSLAISTCPNDTFIFDALVNGQIPSRGLEFETRFADIGDLNRLASDGIPDVVKVSYAHLPALLDTYVALTAGGALGFGCGPLLVAKDKSDFERISSPDIAVPGLNTTANFLLNRYFPTIEKKTVLLFSGIVDAVSAGNFDAGLIIHESRFTFRDKGLQEVADLGNLWHQETGLPIPLGCIVARRNLPQKLLLSINTLIAESVAYAFAHPDASEAFVGRHAMELSPDVIRQHIHLYVNDFSLDLKPLGKKAVRTLLKEKLSPESHIFVDDPV